MTVPISDLIVAGGCGTILMLVGIAMMKLYRVAESRISQSWRLQGVAKMGDAVSFKRALDKARQKHRSSWLYHLAVPLMTFIGFALPTALGQGKLDQLFGAVFFLSLAVWAISDSHVFGLAVDVQAGLDATEETIEALQEEILNLKSEIVSLKGEVADLSARVGED